MFLRLVYDRVPVHHHHPMIGHIVQKTLAYPTKIPSDLVFHWDAGPNSGMDKEVISELETVDHRFQEIDVRLRHARFDAIQNFERGSIQNEAAAHAIAFGAFGASVHEPVLEDTDVSAQYAQKELFVIALEKDISGECGWRIENFIQHAPGIGATVHEIAKEDEIYFRCGPVRIVLTDPFEKVAKQIQPAVYVANGISSAPSGAGGQRVARFGKQFL
jgi:hypothetical protein